MTNNPSNWKAHMISLAEQAANELQGTCKAIYELGEEFEAAADDMDFCNRLDELVFECEVCNWWYEQSEMAEREDLRWICQECNEDGE